MKTIKLIRTLSLSALLTAPLFACGGPESGAGESPDELESQDEAVIIAPALDMCRIAAADVTQTLTALDDEDRVTSGSLAYGSRTGCTRFVADFSVLNSASPATANTNDFLADGTVLGTFEGLSAANCAATRVNITRYRRAVGATGFTAETSAIYVGSYSAPGPGVFGGCFAVLSSGNQAILHEPNPAGTETYRVAVRATRNGTVLPVEASIGFVTIPH
jgi:hypothetical protein